MAQGRGNPRVEAFAGIARARQENIMPFPESKRVVYQQNPLVEVICQIRFPTILQIGSEEPTAFQNSVRAEYPLYEKADRPGKLPREISELLDNLQKLMVLI